MASNKHKRTLGASLATSAPKRIKQGSSFVATKRAEPATKATPAPSLKKSSEAASVRSEGKPDDGKANLETSAPRVPIGAKPFSSAGRPVSKQPAIPFLANPALVHREGPEVITKWSEMNLKVALLNGLLAMGFERPSAIQQRAILPIIRGKDVICQSQSGTGKTAVFCLGALQVVRETSKTLQAIVLSPTRELAEQTSKVMSSLGQFTNVKIRTCVGGKSMKEDKAYLKDAHVVSGTPGRVYDVFKRNYVDSSHISLFVVDEADEMISSGQKATIYDLFRDLPSGVQVVLVSATMSAQVMDMSRDLLTDPVRVLVKREQTSVKAIDQYYMDLEGEQNKVDALCMIYDNITISQAIVFCNTRKKVDALGKQLKERGFAVTCIHGEMTQTERDKVMQHFRAGSTRVLITTDILGRGIDVQQVSLVVNYDLPLSKELYIHRIGRAGRWGRKGLAISFCTGDEREEGLRAIEKFYKMKVSRLPKDLSKLENT
jgi:superfamily II DNA/RNA helicase